MKMEKIVYNYLEERNMLSKLSNDASKTSLKITDDAVILNGNRIDLIILADYIVSIALNGVRGSHIHLDQLDGTGFFDEAEKDLIIGLSEE